MQEAIVRFLSAHGALAQPEALAFLAGLNDPVGALERGLRGDTELPFIVTLRDARRLTGTAVPPEPAKSVEHPLDAMPKAAPTPKSMPKPAPPARPHPAARRIETPPPQVSRPAALEPPAPAPVVRAPPPTRAAPSPARPIGVAMEPVKPQGALSAAPLPKILADVTGTSTCEGTIDDFAKLFRDRFARMRRLYRKRRELVGATTIERLNRSGQQVKFLAIVNEVRTTKKGHRLLEVEDDTGTAAVLAPKSDGRLIEISDSILSDEIVGIIGRTSSRGPSDDGLIILDELIRPELPLDHANHYGAPGSAVFVSDVHLGSYEFLQDQWTTFLDWIAGRRPEGRDLAHDVRWLVINGDLVEGVGIYPGQDKDLEIDDYMEQYKEAARQLAKVPDHIRVILAPGNHDAVRPAEPQPAFPEAIKELFGPNVTCVGNPCALNLDGVEVLAYHGVSLFDFFQALPHVDINHPLETMREMLIRRHLCPIYGGRTPLAPEHRDYMVIEHIPDIFVTGHVHASDVAEYRGVTLVNSSTWQSQTDYQKMLGFEPDPCKAFHVDLATGLSTVLDFNDAPELGDPKVEDSKLRRLTT